MCFYVLLLRCDQIPHVHQILYTKRVVGGNFALNPFAWRFGFTTITDTYLLCKIMDMDILCVFMYLYVCAPLIPANLPFGTLLVPILLNAMGDKRLKAAFPGNNT